MTSNLWSSQLLGLVYAAKVRSIRTEPTEWRLGSLCSPAEYQSSCAYPETLRLVRSQPESFEVISPLVCIDFSVQHNSTLFNSRDPCARRYHLPHVISAPVDVGVCVRYVGQRRKHIRVRSTRDHQVLNVFSMLQLRYSHPALMTAAVSSKQSSLSIQRAH